MRWLSIAALALFGCGSETDIGPDATSKPTSDGGVQLSTRTVFRFVPDEFELGPRIALRGELQDDLLRLELVGSDIDDVFGYRVWLNYPDTTTVEASTPLASLGPLTEARYAVVAAERMVSIGGTRRNPTLGNISMVERTLAEVNLRVRQEDLPSFGLSGVLVRRSDGTAISVAAVGGAIQQFEEPRR